MPVFERQQSPTRSGEPVRAPRVDRTTSRPVHADNPLLAQQGALGNQGMQHLLLTGALRAKLRVGQPNDAYEQEAERVEETVMRVPEPEVQRQTAMEDEEEEEAIRTEPLAEGITPLIQRQTEASPEEEEEEEPPQSGPAPSEVQRLVQRQEAEPSMEEEEEPLSVQRNAKGADITHTRDAGLVQRLRSPNGGAPLPGGTRAFFERRFGYDFSGVRIHEAYQDRADAGSLGARAFTYGKHIWLGEGESATDSHLMAHELTHVVQQNAGVGRASLAVSPASPRVQRQSSVAERAVEPDGGASGSAGERTERADERAEPAKDGIRSKLAQWARRIPGYDLLAIVLGRDPISGERVERNALNVIRGVLGLIPGGGAMFENLEKTGAITRAFEWFNAEISRLNLTWEAIKELFQTAWEALSWRDILDLSGAIDKVARVFAPTLARLRAFAVAAGRKVLEFIFEGVLSLAGGFGSRVLAILRRAGALFFSIINDPIGFIGNLVTALRGGFERFSDNILDHLRTALMQWLFGALRGAGLTLPDRFDLKGVVSIVLQVLGLTYDRLRAKLVGLIGEKNVARIEGAFDFLRTIVTGGLAAAWEKIVEYVENLQEMVIGGIRDWVAKSVVGAAIKKLVTLFNPAGAIIQALMAIYNTVVFFIERAQEIAALADAVFDSISNVAVGNVGAAISYVERTMARALPVIISFLARLIGLGSISGRIRDIIEKIRAPVDQAIDRVATFIVQKVRSLFTGEREATGEDETPRSAREERWEAAVVAVRSDLHRMEEEGVDEKELNAAIPRWHEQHGFSALTVEAKDDEWVIEGSMSPAEVVEKVERPGSKKKPFELTWPKPPSSDYPVLYFGGPTDTPRRQSVLKERYLMGRKDSTGEPIRAFTPHEGGALSGGQTLGIGPAYRIDRGTIVGPLSDETTPGGERLNSVLRNYGFRPLLEGMDADHVREIQFGGEDVIENLWPLDASINRRSGPTLARARVKYPASRKEASIDVLKTFSRNYYFKITDFSY